MIAGNIQIRPFCNNDFSNFAQVFGAYFKNDFNIEISEVDLEKLCLEIVESSITGVMTLDLLFLDGKMVGFILYQIDTPKSDWCEREGLGFIREIYVEQTLRGGGFGSKLVQNAEETLYNYGCDHIYLTSDESGGFWESCGYMNTGEISDINHDPIYEKKTK